MSLAGPHTCLSLLMPLVSNCELSRGMSLVLNFVKCMVGNPKMYYLPVYSFVLFCFEHLLWISVFRVSIRSKIL